MDLDGDDEKREAKELDETEAGVKEEHDLFSTEEPTEDSKQGGAEEEERKDRCHTPDEKTRKVHFHDRLIIEQPCVLFLSLLSF